MSELEINPVKAILEGDYPERIHEPSPDICTFEAALDRIESWRQLGCFTVFNAGTYDMLTVNHILGLVQCRVLGAAALLGIDKIKTLEDRRKVQEVAASESIRLMVTLDTDRALEEGKSRRPEKGGAPKPTLGWGTRAMMLAMPSIPAPEYEVRRNAVDYITRHGPGCCEACPDGACVNNDNAQMAVELQPNLVVVNSESYRTVADLNQYKEGGLLPNTQIAVVVEKDNEYCDPLLDGPVTTTAIIKRIKS